MTDSPHQPPRSTIKKAQKWRDEHATTYNENLFKLIFNALSDILHNLDEEHRPYQPGAVRTSLRKDIDHLRPQVQDHCISVIKHAVELWSLGVFHWLECRDIVLGPLYTPLPMARKRQDAVKAKTKGRFAMHANKSTSKMSVKRRCDDDSGDQIENGDHSSRTSNQNKSDKGDENQTPIEATQLNDQHASKEALLVDEDDGHNEEEMPPPAYGVDIFYAASKRDMRDYLSHQQRVSSNANINTNQRSLQDLLFDHQDICLSNLSEATLQLAGQAVKQTVLEATHEFVTRCAEGLSDFDRSKLWAQLINGSDTGPSHQETITNLPMPVSFPVDPRRLPVPELMATCITVLRAPFNTPTPQTLKLVFARGVTLCDALGDIRRRDALQRALRELSWLILGLDAKSLQMYRSINQQLDQINIQLQSELALMPSGGGGQGGSGGTGRSGQSISAEQYEMESNMLQRHAWTYEDFKEPFRLDFVQTLRRLLKLGE